MTLALGGGGGCRRAGPAARAAWYAYEALRRGCEVVPATVEAGGPVTAPVGPAYEMDRRLARATRGRPVVVVLPADDRPGRPAAVVRVTPGGDSWPSWPQPPWPSPRGSPPPPSVAPGSARRRDGRRVLREGRSAMFLAAVVTGGLGVLYPAGRRGGSAGHRRGHPGGSGRRPGAAAPGAGWRRFPGPSRSQKAPGADRYLQLPEVASDVRALAARLTAPAPTTYGKVDALRSWLDGTIRATDTATAVPGGADALEQLLLTDRAGWPERISAALAVMLRSLGIPSRLAVGFLPGRRAGLGGAFEVRASDATAWVEMWFPGAGWQRCDPTGKAPAPGAPDVSIWARVKRLLAGLWPLLLLVALVAATYAAWLARRWRRRRAALPWATRFFARVERAGRAGAGRGGRRRRRGSMPPAWPPESCQTTASPRSAIWSPSRPGRAVSQ